MRGIRPAARQMRGGGTFAASGERDVRIPGHILKKRVPVSNVEVVARPAAVFPSNCILGAEWSRLALLYGFIGLLHVVGWGTYMHTQCAPPLVGWLRRLHVWLRHASTRTTSQRSTTRALHAAEGPEAIGGRVLLFIGPFDGGICPGHRSRIRRNRCQSRSAELQALGTIIGAGVSELFCGSSASSIFWYCSIS